MDLIKIMEKKAKEIKKFSGQKPWQSATKSLKIAFYGLALCRRPKKGENVKKIGFSICLGTKFLFQQDEKYF